MEKEKIEYFAYKHGFEATAEHAHILSVGEFVFSNEDFFAFVKKIENEILEQVAKHFDNHTWMEITTDDVAQEVRRMKEE